jgi:hypothetical protein
VLQTIRQTLIRSRVGQVILPRDISVQNAQRACLPPPRIARARIADEWHDMSTLSEGTWRENGAEHTIAGLFR